VSGEKKYLSALYFCRALVNFFVLGEKAQKTTKKIKYFLKKSKIPLDKFSKKW
jgi:hypothetical protein